MRASGDWPALESRNFRLYIGGQAISLVGTSMQQVAVAWLVYRLTQSPLALGAVAFATEMCGVAMVLFGGLLADRASPLRVVLASQSLAMLQALALATLVLTGHATLPGIVALSCFLALVNGLDVPARQVLVAHLVDRRQMGNAIVLTSVATDLSRLVGPSLGGAIVSAYGEWPCFLLNAASYLFVIGALLAVRIAPPPEPVAAPAEATAGVGARLAEGFRYTWNHGLMRNALLLVALVAFAGGPYMVLMPVMAAQVLGGDASTLGLLAASTGIGALGGALHLGRRGTATGYDRLLGLGAGVFGTSLALFSQSAWLPLSALLLAACGYGLMLLMACTHTLLLLLADEDKRGRVMSLFTLSFMAAVPFGSLAAGALASVVHVPAVLMGGGIACALGAVAHRMRLGAPLQDRRSTPRHDQRPAPRSGAGIDLP